MTKRKKSGNRSVQLRVTGNWYFDDEDRFAMTEGVEQLLKENMGQCSIDKYQAQLFIHEGEPDKCELCLGVKGGARGNENVVDGAVVCDYCTSRLMDMEKFRKNACLICKKPVKPGQESPHYYAHHEASPQDIGKVHKKCQPRPAKKGRK